MNMRRRIFGWIIPVLAMLLLASAAHACPMCKDSVPNSDAQQAGSLPGGFNNSVYFMLVSFITVVVGVTTFIVRTVMQSGRRSARGFRVIDP
jgi:hypothetical protein